MCVCVCVLYVLAYVCVCVLNIGLLHFPLMTPSTYINLGQILTMMITIMMMMMMMMSTLIIVGIYCQRKWHKRQQGPPGPHGDTEQERDEGLMCVE